LKKLRRRYIQRFKAYLAASNDFCCVQRLPTNGILGATVAMTIWRNGSVDKIPAFNRELTFPK
jgi:hypothetical protein